MAEEQDKQKPKATLIKKKHEAAPESAPEKKKVRVVVKRKPRPKESEPTAAEAPAAEKASETSVRDSSSAPTAPAEKQDRTVPTSGDGGADTPPRTSEAAQATEVPDSAGKDDTTSSEPPGSKNRETPPEGRPERPTRPQTQREPTSETRRPTGSRPGGIRPQQGDRGGDSRYGGGGPGAGSSGPGRGGYSGPNRGGDSRYGGGGPGAGSSGPPRGGYGGPNRGGDSRYGGGGPGAGGSGPPRGGYGGPNRGGDSRYGGGGPNRSGPTRYGGAATPGGAPPRQQRSGPGGPPGRPQRGGAPGAPGAPGGGAPGAAGKTPGKKFYKSRKNRGTGFERDERLPEKELRYNRKKPQPKANPTPKQIDIMEVITVSELARKMNLKANELIGKLMTMGMMVTINQQIDAETAEILASEYDCKVNIVSLYDETIIETDADKAEDLGPRSPIVTVMGHVDHGKTKLLDAIRSTDVAGDEQGGITQHIGAYQVALEEGSITFLDTPGHEAFTLMRARGAQVTDIVVLVVAANDGVMPQTKEALDHAKDAGVPIIVAINKVDLPEANVDRVKQQLSEHGLVAEDWGGDTAMVEVSALKREGIENLLSTILVQAEVMELTANYSRGAEGKIIESRIDPGRGTVASVLIERGTLHVGDSFVAGIFSGKIRALFNDRGQKVTEATPSMPVEIIGLDGVPDSGDPFQVTEDDKTARQVGSKRQELKRVEAARNVKKVTLDNLYDSIQEGAVQELKVVIKGDVHGSVEALQNALERLSTGEVRLVAIHSAAGAINEGDVMLASASNAIVIGFHVRPTPRAIAAAEREKVEIRKYSIIYDAVEDIRSAMEGMLAPDLKEQTIGSAEVRDTFKVPKIGLVAGCYVTSGKFQRNAKVRVFRDEVQIHESSISSLRRFKDDVREVDTGYECGIGVEGVQDIKVGDILEAFVVREVAKKL
jgi:translation initiation factor IF-2